MRRILAAVAALGLVLGGAAAATAAPRAKSGLAWRGCNEPVLQSRAAECAFLTVPLDHARPDGKKIKLAVSRIKHTVPDDEYQGVMLTNPGGPGGSGVAMSVLGEFVPRGVGAAYDWIGFDPRGVGYSQPSLSCDHDYSGPGRPAYVPATPAIEKAWRKRALGYAADCDRAGGELLEHLKTTDNVRDMDLLRQALGAQKINFYGFSYGTYLGQVYATMFPERVRRMVFDGNVDPGRVWYDANLDQDLAFERNLRTYFDWVARYDSVYHLGRTGTGVERRFEKERAALAAKPAGIVGGNELNDVFVQAGYYVFGWETLATAFSAWVVGHDKAPLEELVRANAPTGKGADNGYAIYLGTTCTDAPWPTSWKKWRDDSWSTHEDAPFATWYNTWFNAPCLTWSAEPGERFAVDGRKAPPILLINDTYDAATPYAGSLEVRRRFPSAALVEGVNGTTHAGSLFGSACVDGTVADYLESGKLPKRVKANRSDKQCEPIPQPDPTAAQPEAKRSATSLRLLLQREVAGF